MIEVNKTFINLFSDPNVVITTWTNIYKLVAFCFIIGWVVGYGIARYKFTKMAKSQ